MGGVSNTLIQIEIRASIKTIVDCDPVLSRLADQVKALALVNYEFSDLEIEWKF